jgi:peptide/nickel transport system permease protein
MKAGHEENLRVFFTVPVTIALSVLILLLTVSIFAGRITAHDPNALDVRSILASPSEAHLLGTDKTGRDLFSRLLFGSRITILSAFGVVIISGAIGIPAGMAAGYFGGATDKVLTGIFDIIISFPSLLLAFVLVAAFGRGIINAVFALGIVYVPMLAKHARSLVLIEKNKVYVEAARSIGYSAPHIIMVEILPNCAAMLAVQMMLDVGYAILDLAAMSFMGLGVQPPTADWGAMLEDGWIVIVSRPLVALAPGVMIVITAAALNVFGDGVRAYLDPAHRRLPSMRKFRRMMREDG